MKTTARLVLAGALAAASFGITSPASACDDPRKCASCKVNSPQAILSGSSPITCYS